MLVRHDLGRGVLLTLDRESSAGLLALVLGAQAAYRRAGAPDLAVPPFDADTDLEWFLSTTSAARVHPRSTSSSVRAGGNATPTLGPLAASGGGLYDGVVTTRVTTWPISKLACRVPSATPTTSSASSAAAA